MNHFLFKMEAIQQKSIDNVKNNCNHNEILKKVKKNLES